MNKIILKNGLFGSVIVSAMLIFVTIYMKENPEKEVSMFFGFAGMILSFFFVIWGIKQ